MKYLKLLIMASLLSFYGCTGDDDDGNGSSSSTGSAFSCALAEQAFNIDGSFEELNLGSVEASCSNGIVTLSVNASSSEKTSLTCDGVTFGASGESSNMTIDFSQVSISGPSMSGTGVYTINLAADVEGAVIDCDATINVDMSRTREPGYTPEGMEDISCTVGSSTVTFSDTQTAEGGCNNADANVAALANFLTYYSYLGKFGG